ncbi:hypothetical protein ACIQC7_17645 [Kitasatospora sp. NPDC088556]|uniref:hypothetical protein n=1 Tax=Kitasatospora sp. NPDC088556 TaxID=3364076 RepID=UPI0038047CBB
MTNGDMKAPGLPLSRDAALAALGEAAQWWGCDVPDDPGTSELAALLNELVERLRTDHRDERLRSAVVDLAEVAEALGAASRLGGLLPAISLWHLRTAVEKEQQARHHLARAATAQPNGVPLSTAVS